MSDEQPKTKNGKLKGRPRLGEKRKSWSDYKHKYTGKMNLVENKDLDAGDIAKIAKATGYSYDYTQKVLKGERSQVSKGAKLIITAFNQVVAHNTELLALCDEIRHNAINEIEPALYGRENFTNTLQA